MISCIHKCYFLGLSWLGQIPSQKYFYRVDERRRKRFSNSDKIWARDTLQLEQLSNFNIKKVLYSWGVFLITLMSIQFFVLSVQTVIIITPTQTLILVLNAVSACCWGSCIDHCIFRCGTCVCELKTSVRDTPQLQPHSLSKTKESALKLGCDSIL